MLTKEKKLPSETFISAYLDSFRAKPSTEDLIKADDSTDESTLLLKQACEMLDKRDWSGCLELINQSILKNSWTSPKTHAKALNLRATFTFLIGSVDESICDIDESLKLDPSNINSIIKRATLFMEMGEIQKTVEEFTNAEKYSTTDVDMFYHRFFIFNNLVDKSASYREISKELRAITLEVYRMKRKENNLFMCLSNLQYHFISLVKLKRQKRSSWKLLSCSLIVPKYTIIMPKF
jgi:import receptor subunit TOM70